MDRKTLSGSLLVVGTAVGGGMLAIPLVTGRAGFFPAALISALVALFMCATGLLLLEVVLSVRKEVNLLTLTRSILGPKSAVCVAITFAFLYYCLLAAYFSFGSALVEQLTYALTAYSLGYNQALFLFFFLFAPLIFLGIWWVDSFYYLAIGVMACTYCFLLISGSQDMVFARWEEKDFLEGIWSVPILFSAFGYHNIIPSLSAYFSYERKVLQRSIVYGCFLVFFVYLSWQALIFGLVPKEALWTISREDPSWLFKYWNLGGPLVKLSARLFSFFAIVTSFLGVSFSMIDFWGDAFGLRRKGKQRAFLGGVTFFPPLLIALYYPQIFLHALELAGGFGEAVLNGALPILLVALHRKATGGNLRWLRSLPCLALLLLFTLCVILLEGKIVWSS
ncbi:MAG: aromatic amino acid transport family protein [Chlamydiota bacterium]